MSFTVVIATYNRPKLLRRAIESALRQGIEELEIIVVDDASNIPLASVVDVYPGIVYLRQERNQGPGPARNRGIAHASRPFVVILDDDDELLPGALTTIRDHLLSYPERTKYPVFQFRHGNGKMNAPFQLIRFDDYQTGAISGDFLPVIARDLFLNLGYRYPNLRIGAEHLLWWEIAHRFGIPTWSTPVCRLHADAPTRLTSPKTQIVRAREYAEMQELTLEKFGDLLKERFPAAYRTRKLGAATYWLLAGERERAIKHLRSRDLQGVPAARVLELLSWMPQGLISWLFMIYRRVGR